MKAAEAGACNRRLLLRDGTEIIGILESVVPDGLVLRCLKYDIQVSTPPDIKGKAAKLVGKRVGILHLGNKFYIREAERDVSISETPLNNGYKTWKCNTSPFGRVTSSGDICVGG